MNRIVLCGMVSLLVTVVAPHCFPATETSTVEPSLKAREDSGDQKIVARGKGVIITRAELIEECARLQLRFAKYDPNLPASDDNASPQMIEKLALDSLLMNHLWLARATEADKLTAKSQFETKVKERLKDKTSDQEFDRELAKTQPKWVANKERWKSWLIENATIDLVCERELAANLHITTEQIRKYYDAHPEEFQKPESIRVRLILLATVNQRTGLPFSRDQRVARHKLAEDLIKRARDGEEFAKLAREYSEIEGSGDKGREYIFLRGREELQFENVAFSLATNQVSDLIETDRGFQVLQLIEKNPAGRFELSRVSEQIRAAFTWQQNREFVEKIKREAALTIVK